MPYRYLEYSDLKFIFGVVYEFYSKQEEVPDYINDRFGINKLMGIFEGVKQDFYPSLSEKAAYFLLQINKGHFFSNGNKRLALVCTTSFLFFNNHEFRSSDKKFYKELMNRLFPSFSKLEDSSNFLPEEFGLYNLSILIADSQNYISEFKDLKSKVEEFIRASIIKMP